MQFKIICIRSIEENFIEDTANFPVPIFTITLYCAQVCTKGTMLEVTFITEFFFTQIAISLCSCEFLYHLLHRCMEGYQHTIIFSHMHRLHMLLQQKSWFACLTTNLTLFSCDCKNSRFSSLHFKYQIVTSTIGDLWCNRHLLRTPNDSNLHEEFV